MNVTKYGFNFCMQKVENNYYRSEDFNQWEENFLASMKIWVESGKNCSAKQFKTLVKIFSKVCGSEYFTERYLSFIAPPTNWNNTKHIESNNNDAWANYSYEEMELSEGETFEYVAKYCNQLNRGNGYEVSAISCENNKVKISFRYPLGA